MKKIVTLTVVSCLAAASFITLSSFNTPKKPKKNAPPLTAYSITLQGKQMVGTNEEWTWMLVNSNPGNGNNGTLQDVSHWSMALPAAAEAALVSAEVSNDGNNWRSLPIEVERDPSIRVCTSIDVLKFNVGTNGSDPVYYRATFSKRFYDNPYATSWIKTGGGMQGCNMFFFAGLSASERFD